MGCIKFVVFLVIPCAIAVGAFLCCWKESVPPSMVDGWWGRGPADPKSDSSIDVKPFHINVQNSTLSDLQHRLKNTRLPYSIKGTNFEYGFHSEYMKEIVEYWLNKYNWRSQEAVLNSMNQFTTNIEGIDIHFVRIIPKKFSGKYFDVQWTVACEFLPDIIELPYRCLKNTRHQCICTLCRTNIQNKIARYTHIHVRYYFYFFHQTYSHNTGQSSSKLADSPIQNRSTVRFKTGLQSGSKPVDSPIQNRSTVRFKTGLQSGSKTGRPSDSKPVDRPVQNRPTVRFKTVHLASATLAG